MSLQTPSDVDRFLGPIRERGSKFYGAVGIAALLVLVGLIVWALELTGGHLSNLSNWGTQAGVPWGLDIGAFKWWTGIAIGALVLSAVVRVMRFDDYLGFARVGEFLAPLGFLMGFLHILFDLGRPERVFNTFIYVQFESPLFWDIVLIGGLVVLCIVYLVTTVRDDVTSLVADGQLSDDGLHGTLAREDGSKDSSLGWWVGAIVLAFVPVVGGGLVPWAWSQAGVRLNWFGALQGPTFLLMSLTAGLAAVLLIAVLLRSIYDWDDVFSDRQLNVVSGITAAVGFFYLVGSLFEIQSGTFAANMAQSEVASALASGSFGGVLLLIVVAIALPTIVFGVQLATDRFTTARTFVAAVVLLLGIVGLETWLVVGGLTYPELMYPASEYVPSLSEWVKLLGTVGLTALGLLILARFLPLVPIRALDSGDGE